MKKYEKGEHLEYIRGFARKGARSEVCHAIVGLAIDDDTDELASDDDNVEGKLFDLAVYWYDPAYEDEQEENYQKILELLGVSEPKE